MNGFDYLYDKIMENVTLFGAEQYRISLTLT